MRCFNFVPRVKRLLRTCLLLVTLLPSVLGADFPIFHDTLPFDDKARVPLNDCSAEQQRILRQAFGDAKNMAQVAANFLNNWNTQPATSRILYNLMFYLAPESPAILDRSRAASECLELSILQVLQII